MAAQGGTPRRRKGAMPVSTADARSAHREAQVRRGMLCAPAFGAWSSAQSRSTAVLFAVMLRLRTAFTASITWCGNSYP
eukprot:669643-Prymnesium_polylepis.1